MFKHVKALLPAATALGVLGCSNIALSYVLGSKTAYFGLSNIIMPALTAISGVAGCVLMMVYLVLKIGGGKLLVTKGIPTFFSLLSVQNSTPNSSSLWINVSLPTACMAAFILHPVGGPAWSYTMFWLIPIGCEILRRASLNTLFVRLLAATFVAHAVGSVMWIYTVPSTVDTWLSLRAIVPAERLIFVCGATLTALLLKAAGMYAYTSWKKLKINS